MFTISDIITRAYYLAGMLSEELSQTPSAAQTTSSLFYLNLEIEKLATNIGVNPFPIEKTIPLSTLYLYLGESISSTDENVTVVNEPFLNYISGASVAVGSVNYPLTVLSYTRRFKRSLISVAAYPKRLFYDVRRDTTTNTLYNVIMFDPYPQPSYQITLYGGQSLQTASDDTAVVEPVIGKYLMYSVASNLAQSNARYDDFVKSGKQALADNLYTELKENMPIDLYPQNDGDILFSKQNLGILDGIGQS